MNEIAANAIDLNSIEYLDEKQFAMMKKTYGLMKAFTDYAIEEAKQIDNLEKKLDRCIELLEK